MLGRDAALERLSAEPPSPEVDEILRFLSADRRRSLIGWRRVAGGGADQDD